MRNLILAAEAGGPAVVPLSRPRCAKGMNIQLEQNQLEQNQIEQNQLEQKQLEQEQLIQKIPPVRVLLMCHSKVKILTIQILELKIFENIILKL